MLPLLFPLVTTFAPGLVSWLFGSKAGDTAGKVAAVVQSVTGADPANPDGAAAVQAMLAGKPELAIQLQQQLAQLQAQLEQERDREADAQRQSELDAIKQQLADVAGARQQTVDLAKAGSEIAWSAPVLSAIILVAFAVMLWVTLTRAVPENSTGLANVLLGTLAAMATQVANYWLGSSSGSRAKDATTLALVRKSG